MNFEDPPGVHLSPKIRERILNGYFIDIFTLLRPRSESGKTETKRDKKRSVRGITKHTSQNCLTGYTVYMSFGKCCCP